MSLAEADTRFGAVGFTGSEIGLDAEWAEAEPETAFEKQKEWRLKVKGGGQELMDAAGSFRFTFLADETFAAVANNSSAGDAKESSSILPSFTVLQWLKLRREAKSMCMSIEKYLDHIQQSDSMPPETNPFRTDRPLAQKARTVAAAASRGDPISTSPDRSIQEVPVPRKLPAKDATPPLTRPVPGPSPATAVPAKKEEESRQSHSDADWSRCRTDSCSYCSCQQRKKKKIRQIRKTPCR